MPEDDPFDVVAPKFDRRGGAGTAVLVSTLRTSVTCDPVWPGPTRTSRVSPGCTVLMPLILGDEALRLPEPCGKLLLRDARPSPGSELSPNLGDGLRVQAAAVWV